MAKVEAIIGGDASGLLRATRAAERGLSKMADEGRKASRTLATGFSAVANAAATATKVLGATAAAVTGIGIAAVRSYAKFETAFAQVRTLIDETSVDVKGLSDGVRELSRTFGVDVTEAANAAYQAISAGQDPAEVLDFLAASFEGASAGAASVAESVDLFTTVLNSFGESAGSVEHVADVMFATIKAGKTTMSELAASFGQVAPVAASAGVSVEEVSAALATLTASGLNTAESATALKATLVGILSPSREAAAALDRIGVSSDTLREQGLADTIVKVRDAIEAGNSELVDFFPNVRALVGVATLAGEGFDKFNQSLEATTNATGAAGEAYEKVAGSLEVQFARVRETLLDIFRSVGEALSPFARRLLTAFGKVANDIQAELTTVLDLLQQRFTPVTDQAFADFEEAAGGAADSTHALTDAIDGLGSSMQSVGQAISSSAGAVAGAWTALVTIGKTFELGVRVLAGALGALVRMGLELARVFGADVTRELNQLNKMLVDNERQIMATISELEDFERTYHDARIAVADFGRAISDAGDATREFATDAREATDAARDLAASEQELAERTENLSRQGEGLAAVFGDTVAGALVRINVAFAEAQIKGQSFSATVRESFESVQAQAPPAAAAVERVAEAVGAATENGNVWLRLWGSMGEVLAQTSRETDAAAAATNRLSDAQQRSNRLMSEREAFRQRSMAFAQIGRARTEIEPTRRVRRRETIRTTPQGFVSFGSGSAGIFGLRPGRVVGQRREPGKAFQFGGPVMQDTVAALHGGEFVLNRGAAAMLGQVLSEQLNRMGLDGGKTINVSPTFNLSTAPDSLRQQARSLLPELTRAVELGLSAKDPL